MGQVHRFAFSHLGSYIVKEQRLCSARVQDGDGRAGPDPPHPDDTNGGSHILMSVTIRTVAFIPEASPPVVKTPRHIG